MADLTYKRLDDKFLTQWYRYIVSLLQKAGLSPMNAAFAAHQVFYETNGLTSRLAVEDKNMSGIKYVGQKGAVKGRKSPEGNYYASYPSYQAWANDFARILKLKPAYPYKSINLRDYVRRLAANHYFTANEDQYFNNLQASMNKYAKIFNDNTLVRSVLDGKVKTLTEASADRKELQTKGGPGLPQSTGFNAWLKNLSPVQQGIFWVVTGAVIVKVASK